MLGESHASLSSSLTENPECMVECSVSHSILPQPAQGFDGINQEAPKRRSSLLCVFCHALNESRTINTSRYRVFFLWVIGSFRDEKPTNTPSDVTMHILAPFNRHRRMVASATVVLKMKRNIATLGWRTRFEIERLGFTYGLSSLSQCDELSL